MMTSLLSYTLIAVRSSQSTVRFRIWRFSLSALKVPSMRQHGVAASLLPPMFHIAVYRTLHNAMLDMACNGIAQSS